MISGLLIVGLLLMVGLALLALKVYGIVLAFRAKWYIGAVALFVPLFAEVLAIAKLAFKKDLLA